jgi:hypothetical protein
MKKTLFVLITLALLVIAGQLKAQTNPASSTMPAFAPISVSGLSLTGIVGTNTANGLQQVIHDGAAVFSQITLSNPCDVAVIGIKSGKQYGGGFSVSQTPTNSVVGVGFGFFAMQKTVLTPVTYKHKPQMVPLNSGWNFYDATLSLSVSQVEMIPVLNIPLTLRLETGPAMRLSNPITVLEQSALYATIELDWFKGWPIRLGGGVIHCSDPAFNNKGLPFAVFSVNHKL